MTRKRLLLGLFVSAVVLNTVAFTVGDPIRGVGARLPEAARRAGGDAWQPAPLRPLVMAVVGLGLRALRTRHFPHREADRLVGPPGHLRPASSRALQPQEGRPAPPTARRPGEA